MTKIIRKDLDKDIKAGCCNWESSTLYSFDGYQGKDWENGLCAYCFMDMMVYEGFDINVGD